MKLFIAALLALWALASARADEGAYPSRPVRLIVPLGAGSSPDVRVRALAERLSALLGQRFFVENRPGAGTTLGNAAVAEAHPDGYTLLAALAPALQTGPMLYRSARYDPVTSFTPIGIFSRASPFLVVSAAAPARGVAGLLEQASQRPGGLLVAFSGPGGVSHLPAEMLRSAAGATFLYVPYKSEIDSMADLIAQRVDASFQFGAIAVPQVQAGRLRALAYAGAARSGSLPDVPTLEELGFQGLEFHVLLLLLGPAGLPGEVVARLGAALRAATLDASLQQQFERTGSQLVFGDAEQTALAIRADAAQAGKLVRQLRIAPE